MFKQESTTPNLRRPKNKQKNSAAPAALPTVTTAVPKSPPMFDTVKLEWTFTPPDYVEEPRTIAVAHYAIAIDNGKAEATIDMATYDADPSIRTRLHEALNARFQAAQVMKIGRTNCTNRPSYGFTPMDGAAWRARLKGARL